MDRTHFPGVVQALQKARRLEPENTLVLAMLAELYALDFTHDVGVLENRLETAERLARQALALNPVNQHPRAVLAEVYFLCGQGDSCRAELEDLLSLNATHPSFVYFCGAGFAFLGDWARGVELVQQAMQLNPNYPGYYHFVLFMNEYRQGNCEAALIEARRVDAPGSILGPLSRAVALAQLDRHADAQVESAELFKLAPDFEVRMQELIRRHVFSDENAELLIAGLREIKLSA